MYKDGRIEEESYGDTGRRKTKSEIEFIRILFNYVIFDRFLGALVSLSVK